jgi:hypothetical protein
MKCKYKFLLVVSVLLILTGLIQAQEAFPTFCGSLVEADCKILQQSAVAMRELESTTFMLQADLTVSNIPDSPFESFTVHLNGEGSFAGDFSSFMPLAQQSELIDTEAMYTLMADALHTVKADITLTLELPQELRDVMANEEQALPATLTFDLRMIDGVAYINLTELAALVPEAVPAGWVGLDMAEFYGTVLPQMSNEALAEFDMMSLVQTLMEPDNLAQFITIERLPDSEVSGQDTAVFEMQLNYLTLVELPAFREMLISMLPAEDSVDVEAMLDTIRAMYSGLLVVITQNIGLDDLLIHETNVDMTWDLAAFADTIGEPAAAVVELNFVLTSESFNTAFEVPAPENATLLPLQQMMPIPESDE